ncbi:MAG TPA: glycosyltransferase [Candidatus Binatus sp.]|nr:glycosyltransferase [Candidatus Binatus sp.]
MRICCEQRQRESGRRPAYCRFVVGHGGPGIAIGIMAHNEAESIGHLLDGILRQSAAPRIERVLVMASACTDGTDEIVCRYASHDPRIELHADPERKGKVHAINRFIELVDQPLCIITSADVSFHPTTVERICAPFSDPAIGVVGARIIPVNRPNTFLGFTINLMWTLHHDLALVTPKLGEICAFRNVIDGVNPAALYDEMSVLFEVEKRGYKAAYAADALIENCGPGNISDFIEQRTRWIVANLSVEREWSVRTTTLQPTMVARAAARYMREDWRHLHWFAGAALIELWARMRARVEYAASTRRRFQVWRPIASTKLTARSKR